MKCIKNHQILKKQQLKNFINILQQFTDLVIFGLSKQPRMYIMKKILLGALIASTALMATSAATAAVTIDQADFKPYVGLDYSYLSGFDKVTLDDVGDNTKYLDGYVNVLGVSFGVQLNDYIGVEASYGKGVSDIDGKKVSLGSYTYEKVDGASVDAELGKTLGKTKFEHITVGLTGQYPIADQVYVKGLVGAAWQRFEASSETKSYEFNGEVLDQKTYAENNSSNNDAVFLAKVGLGYQASKNSVFEINYTREGKLDGLGLQYKYVF